MLSRLQRFAAYRALFLFVLTIVTFYLVFSTHGYKRQDLQNESAAKEKEMKAQEKHQQRKTIDEKEGRREDEEKGGNVDVVVLFTKASGNHVIQAKFSSFLNSLLLHASFPTALHIVGDASSQKIAEKIFAKRVNGLGGNGKCQLILHDLSSLTSQVEGIIKFMRKHFSYKPGSYYSDAFFFISLALHRLMTLNRVIMVDVDVFFKDDIKNLYLEFEKFSSNAVIGIAYEQQPVYRHVFQLYRLNNSDTQIGNPLPDGNPGFNSGVLLLDLAKMKKSIEYNELLVEKTVDELAKKYQFKGHLGDQDFFTLVSLEHMKLFHILPCGWNRQLCEWWRHHGYENVFDKFHVCTGDVKLYHGNCNAVIPTMP